MDINMCKNQYKTLCILVFAVLIAIVYSIIKKERDYEIKNTHVYFKDKKIFKKGIRCDACYNKMTIELSELKNVQGETIVNGYMAISISEPDKYVEKAEIDIVPPGDKYFPSTYIIEFDKDYENDTDLSFSGYKDIVISA